ncbi:malto-oligosyltrehalose trehalohydrolase [Nonlabens tegetincola]|uniref:Malto-oligosyltrehalose trehalohydrolase n=1 Tax=Nonlabens tegetincola TaxID=323273 RepID=A0A090QQQ7_9FLAO|nr:alpha-amylase family glycosyl hydrolase [Nonlabens tegetincola]GAK97826.1 malto-oligosyltrehalose trehalohydrolase [Nonlabens tegetincola]
MKNFYFLLAVIFGFAFAKAQVTTNPSIPTQQDQVTLIFDATGTPLENESGNFYAHTGANINGTRWSNVVGNWGDNTAQPQFVNTGGNMYQATLPGTLETFYNAQPGDVISEICLVIRNAAGTNQTSPDIFIDVFLPGLNTSITSPQDGEIINLNQTINLSADCTQNATLDLAVNGNSVATTSGSSISTSYTFSNPGNYTIAVNADNGTTTVTDQVSVYVPNTTQSIARPAGLKNGVNENADGSVTFLLAAPGKTDVMLLGSFSNWDLDLPYQMNKDGDYFWVTVPSTQFSAGTEFAYQYLVDYSIKIADPYSRLILDDGFDQFIKPGNFDNIYPYPTGETTGDISLWTYQATPYNWNVTNFQRPDQENLVIYEILVRDFSENDSYQEIINRIDYLADLGINALQFMPLNEFEGADSWGYNPKFHMAIDKTYGTPEKFKELVDLCHSKGIAVILDVVYNHAFSQSPLCQMWWDQANFRPAANNPYLNPTARHDFNVGYDFNHESNWTRDYVKQTLQYWIDEYKIDGFRFDLSKGFTQNNTLGNIGAWNAYDQSRVNILNDYKNTIWNNNSNDIYMILEHLGGQNEEAALANDGFMLWGKMTDEFNQNSMGFSSNSNVFRSYYTSRNFNDQHLIAYAESHDEQRLMYKNLQFGNAANSSHNVQNVPVALDRQEAISAILYSIPGPKMLWQFGELGYEIDIDQNGRTGRKPVAWTLGYDTDQDRLDLYDATATFINFKTLYPETFNNTNNNLNVSGLVKTINLNGPNFDAVVLANFAVTAQTANPNFQQTGVWYDYFNNNAVVNVTNTTTGISLQPGEYKLFTTTPLNNPLSNEEVQEQLKSSFIIYPNPAQSSFNIQSDTEIDQVVIYNTLGQVVKTFEHETINYDISDLKSGLYFVQASLNGRISQNKLYIK